MPFYMRNGKRYYRMPDREEGPRGKNVKICLATLGLIVFLDLMATLATRTNAHLLDVMQELLAPISWLFEALGVPITSAYFDGPESQVYYRVLLLLSALLGQSLGVPIAYHFCKRFRFFKYPAYYAKAVQRSAAKGPPEDISTNRLFFFIFVRILWLVMAYLSFVTIWAVYPGRFTFHVNDFFSTILFSLVPGLFISTLPISILSFLSCLICYLQSIKKTLDLVSHNK